MLMKKYAPKYSAPPDTLAPQDQVRKARDHRYVGWVQQCHRHRFPTYSDVWTLWWVRYQNGSSG